VPRCWVTVFGRVNHLGAEPGTQAYSAWACHLPTLEWVPGESLGSKQTYRVTHQPVSVVSQYSLNTRRWLASGDQRRLTGNGSALEACWRRYAILAAFTLLHFIHTISESVGFRNVQIVHKFAGWVTRNPDFKVTIFFNVKYLEMVQGMEDW